MVTFAHTCCVLSPPSHLGFHRNVTFDGIKDVVWSARDEKGVWSDVKPDLTLVTRLCKQLMLLLVEYKRPSTGQSAASTDRCVDRVGNGCVCGEGGGERCISISWHFVCLTDLCVFPAWAESGGSLWPWVKSSWPACGP